MEREREKKREREKGRERERYRVSIYSILSLFQVRYTGYRDRPIHERQSKFLNGCREGTTEIVSII